MFTCLMDHKDYYYFATAGGAKIWVCTCPTIPTHVSLRHSRDQWKKYLTSMQIIQFIIDIVIVYFGSKLINL
jgi:fatty acid elongase 3